jgi:HK97 family phage portal protein
MALLKRALSSSNTASKVMNLSSVESDLIGWHGIGGTDNTYRYYKMNQYENAYPSITKIANEFLTIRPYAADGNNNKIENQTALNKLYHPNKQMSAAEFREALAIMCLVHPKVYILVWRNEGGTLLPGGPITPDNIAGYTFVENVIETHVGGTTYYQSGANRFDEDDLIILNSINPYDLSAGFSPSQAAHRWTTLDDYIADYQAGFFKNGTVPAGMFTITAKTKTDYKNIRENLEERHRGASNNNNVTYNYRPLDQTGKPADAQLEWTPFNTDNKNLDLGALFENVNKKIDSAYGVPDEIKGYLQNSNYASVAVAERVFIRFVVKPFTLKLWTKFTHELNRLTGGLGYAISFDLVIPSIADEELIIAQKLSTHATIVTTLTEAGYTLESVTSYIETGDLKKLVVGTKPSVDDKVDNPDVDAGDEVEDAPEQPQNGDVIPNLQKTKQLQQPDQAAYVEKLSAITRLQTERQVDKALSSLEISTKAYGDTSAEEDEQFAEAILTALTPLIIWYGQKQTTAGIELIFEAGLDADPINNFQMTNAQIVKYRKYLHKVARSYADDTGEIIRETLARSIAEGMSEGEIKRQIRLKLTGADNEYRVRRLARTEVVSSEGRASVASMANIQRDTGFKIYKVWNNGGDNPCEYCLSMKGTRKLVSENFIELGETIHGTDGGLITNDFAARETCTAHPNDECYQTYEVEV